MKKFISRLLTVLRQTYKDFRYNYRHVKLHDANTNEIKYARLRTYCHMLDKGLNNVNFEKGHSLRLLNDVRVLRKELYPFYGQDRCFSWIDDIISKFERSQIDELPALNNQDMKIYSNDQISDYSTFLTRRTSCRNFISKKIPSDVLANIVKVAIDAPNGCCKQVVRYYITQDAEKITRILPHVAGVTNFSNIQCVVCVAAETSFYDLKDKNLQYVDTALSAENFILAASLYGIYGTMCNFFQASYDDIAICKEIYGLKETENINLFMVIGYPTTIPMKPYRRDLDVFYKEV